ncbi:MAG: hypothetical protein QXM92_02875 [Candidatus Anstonellales archaeon]
MDYVKGNLLTLFFAVIAILIAVILQAQVEIAFMLWLSSFLLDASYTFHKRKLLKQYELNILVRRGKNLVLAFVKVVFIEFVMIGLLTIVVTLWFADSSSTASASSSSVLSIFLIFFAVIHVMAFARSYKYMKKLEK